MAGDVASLAFVYKITYQHPVNGPTIIGLTTADVDLVVAGVTYLAALGTTPSSISSKLGLQPSKFEISGALDAAGIVESSIHAGLYDFADVDMYLVNWADTTMGAATWCKAKVSDIQIDGRMWTMEISDISDQLSLSIVELTSQTCRARLFDTRCKVSSTPPAWAASTAYTLSNAQDSAIGSRVKPVAALRRWFRCSVAGTSGGSEPAWTTTLGGSTTDNTVTWTTLNALVMTGSVTAKTSNQVFADSTVTEVNNFWQFGKIVWTSGANAGYQMEIKSQIGTIIELYLPMINTVSVGDTFTLYAGCDLSKAQCKTKFENIYNMRAEPDKPSSTLLTNFIRR
jgi:uncharacterized phage protein (TIGR02218 family)